MMLPAGVVQSIDANIVDLDNAWIFADQDIWSQDYGEVLLQPISIEAVDINDLRFQASEVVVEIRATPDPTSLVLWSGWCETVDDPSGSAPDLDTRISCGVLDPVPPVFVDNGNGTASIFGFRCAVRPVPDYTASPLDFDIPAATLSFANNTESYVCVRYNAGAPVMYVESSQAAINGSDVVLIFVVWRTGNELHSVSSDSRGLGLADKIAGMITRTKPYSLTHGQQLTLGVTTTPVVRTVTIAAATIYAGVDAIPLTAFNSSNPAQRFTRVAPTAGVYSFLNQTQLDNTNYSNGTNVVAMAANRYSPRWVYRTVGDDAQAFYVLGNEYSNIASAQAAPLPTGLPLVVQDHAVLVGRIIVQNGIDTPVQIDQVVSTSFAASTANAHNSLDGLQGTGPDYYHLNATQFANASNGPWLPLTAGAGNQLTGMLFGPSVTLSNFAVLRDRVGNPAYGAIYPTGVTPAATNYVLAMTDAGTETYLGASDKVVLVVGGTSKLTVDADEANLASGVALKMAEATVIDSSRNGSLKSLTVDENIFLPNSVVWKSGATNYFSMYATSIEFGIRDLNDAGSVIAYPLIVKRGVGGEVQIGYSGGLRPVRIGGALKNDALAGTGKRPLVAGADGTIDDQDAATFRGTIGAGTSNLALGETSATAYRGDRGKAAYDHSQATGNPHGTTAAQVGAEPYAGTPAQTSFWRSTAAGGRAWVQLVAADITDLGTTLAGYLTKANPTFTGLLTGPSATLTEFGTLRDRVGKPAYGAIYPTGVTPAATNYVLAFTDSGTDTYLAATDTVTLVVSGTSKLTASSDAVNLGSGVALKFNGTTVIDSFRNANVNSLTATTLSGTGNRPVVAKPAGNLETQDAAAFRTTIGAAASTDLAGYLPLTAGIDKPLTGTLYGTAGAEFSTGALVLVTQGSGSTLAQTYTRGGDLSLAGNGGRANLRIMGSISADTAGVGPGLSFAGVSTGVGATGGGMLLQLTTNNGLDIYSWNNTAWIKKSQINSAGMIAVVGGTAAGFLKANGTIDTTGYLTSINPTYTGRLTGPEQYLENDGQILLAIRRPGGNSGRIHGISFMAQDSASAWVEFGRVMTYISSVTAGAHTGGMRLYAYDAGTIVQALDAGPTGVTFAGLLSGPRATLTEFGTMAAMPGDSNYGTLHATGVTRTSSNYALRLADSGADTMVNAATTVVLAIAGAAKLGVTSSNVNLGSGVSLSFNATTVIDSSRNAAFAGLTTTGNPTFGSTTGSSSIHIDSGAGTASSINFMDNSVTRATLQLYTSNVFRLVARDTAGTEIDSPIYIDLTAGGEITIGGTSRVTNFKNALEMNGVVFVDSSRNATLNNITGGNIVLNTTAQEIAILRRPGATTNLLWGLDFQGQTADLTWVNYNRLQSRIVSATNGAWSGALRVINYNAGVAQITAEFAPTSVNFASGVELQMNGSRLVDTNKQITMGATLTLNTGANPTADIVIRNAANHWTSFYATNVEAGFRDYNNEGSANSYPLYWTLKAGGLLRITRPTNFFGALQMSGTQFLDSSRNASFAGVTATSATLSGNVSFTNSGTTIRGVVGNMGDNDNWRIVGGATGSNAGYLEIATDDDGTEPIYVRQYTGTFASPSAVRSMTLLDANGNTSIPGNLSANGAWIEAVGSNTQGRFKSQYSGAAASYIGNWPANNWWGIGSDGSTTGTKGVLRVGQCASDGAFVTNGVRFAALGDLQASHYVYGNNADFGSSTTPGTTLVVRYGSPSTSPTSPGALYMSCDGGINPRIEFCDGGRNWTIDSYDTNLRFYVNGNIKGQMTESSGFVVKGAVDGTAASVGNVSQVIESRVAIVSVPTINTITTITQIMLTPGCWEVSGHVTASIVDGSNLWTTFYGWCATSTASMPNKGTAIANTVARANTSTDSWATSTITPIRIDVSVNTVCYLLIQFGTGPATSMSAAGAIRALRIR